jgi:hypothetical protein
VAEYRYIFYDVLTNTPTVELPLYGTWFTRELNRAGNATGAIPLGLEGFEDVDTIDGTLPGRTKMYVERDGQLVWGGIVWTRTWQEQSNSFSYTFQSMESFAYKNFIESTLTYTNTDQRNILRSLISTMQAKPSSDIGIVLPDVFPAGGILRTETFNDYDGWTFGKAIEYMVKYDEGFDYTIESRWGTDEAPEDVLRVDNVLGASADITQLAFDYPGNVSNFYYPESAAKGGVSTLGFGKGEGETMIRSKYVAPGYLTTGWPDIQQSYDNKDVSVQATLDSQTQAYGRLRTLPVISTTLELNPDLDPPFGSWQLGDYANVHIESRRFPDGKELSVRIIGYELKPAKKGSDTEELRLVIAEVEE